ncbi:MAG: hypothetical protein HQL31_00475 [Planctomycetes bacterium]|nr:hypothetical protein [Planctomycetota bacterium]
MRCASLIILVLLSVGCESSFFVASRGTIRDEGLTYHNPKIVMRDIPLPKDFCITSGSFCYGTEYFRYGEFHVQGKGNLEDVTLFFRQQLSANQWTETNSQSMETTAWLKCEKNNEELLVNCKEQKELIEIRIVVSGKKQ